MSEYEDLNLTISELPDSRALQASIIAKTEKMPQYIEAKDRSVRAVKNWRRRFMLLMPPAICTVIAVALFLSPGDNMPQDIESIAAEQPEDWREIMLAEDAWLLAEL